MEPRAFAFGKMDPVREDAAGAEEAEAIVDAGVVFRPGKELPYEGDLGFALGEVAVHVAVGMDAGKLAGRAELRLGRGDREAHGDRVAQPPPAMPALDERLAVSDTRNRIVLQCLRGIAIHQRLAADDGLTARFRRGEERIGRASMHGREDHRGGRPVLHQPVEKYLGRGTRMRRRGIAVLLREGKTVQPVEQILAGRREHSVLGEVDVGVDEARQHERLAVVNGGEGPKGLRQACGGSAPGDAAISRDRDCAAPMEPDGAPRPDDRGIVAECQHCPANDPPASRRRTHRDCAASQAPRLERSASVMPVVLPSGMMRFCTVCRLMRLA